MEKFKPLIEESNVYISANGRITIVSWKYQLVENDNIVNFTHNYFKKFKDTEKFSKHSFKFISTDMLSVRINVATCLSGKTLLTL
jgi:hypothetical protein